jgi:urease accessory protein
MSAFVESPQSGWRATLDLQFQQLDGRTVMNRRRHTGPLCVQKAFYPEDGVCHVYMLHPPGGVVGGDALAIDVVVSKRASVLLTTPASTKIYRSLGATSTLDQHLYVEAGASLEWFPRDTLLFGGSRFAQRSVVKLSSESRFCGWEITALGRPKSGDDYSAGQFSQRFELNVDDVPVLIERQAWRTGAPVLSAPWGLHGKVSMASFYGYPADQGVLERARTFINDTDVEEMAATLVDDVLVIRALADDTVALHEALAHIWAGVRPFITRYPACPPRIWAT